jgi:hypothetical protein
VAAIGVKIWLVKRLPLFEDKSMQIQSVLDVRVVKFRDYDMADLGGFWCSDDILEKKQAIL